MKKKNKKKNFLNVIIMNIKQNTNEQLNEYIQNISHNHL